MQEESDETLMMQYARGNAAAFDELYSRYRQPLYRFVLRQVGNASTANDIYQGCWEKIVKARNGFTQAHSFRAWMYRIARNHLVDHYRRSPPVPSQDADQLVDGALSPEQYTGEAQSGQQLNRAIEALPAEQREAILLRLEGGLGVVEIAELTGVNNETAKSRLRYAVNKLRSNLAESHSKQEQIT